MPLSWFQFFTTRKTKDSTSYIKRKKDFFFLSSSCFLPSASDQSRQDGQVNHAKGGLVRLRLIYIQRSRSLAHHPQRRQLDGDKAVPTNHLWRHVADHYRVQRWPSTHVHNAGQQQQQQTMCITSANVGQTLHPPVECGESNDWFIHTINPVTASYRPQRGAKPSAAALGKLWNVLVCCCIKQIATASVTSHVSLILLYWWSTHINLPL